MSHCGPSQPDPLWDCEAQETMPGEQIFVSLPSATKAEGRETKIMLGQEGQQGRRNTEAKQLPQEETQEEVQLQKDCGHMEITE